MTLDLSPSNLERELKGVAGASHLGGKRRCPILTLDQSDHLRHDGADLVVQPVWKWLTE